MHFGPDKCIVIKRDQNLKNLLVSISKDTKVELLKDSYKEVEAIIQENRILNLKKKYQEFHIDFSGDHYSDFC